MAISSGRGPVAPGRDSKTLRHVPGNADAKLLFRAVCLGILLKTNGSTTGWLCSGLAWPSHGPQVAKIGYFGPSRQGLRLSLRPGCPRRPPLHPGTNSQNVQSSKGSQAPNLLTLREMLCSFQLILVKLSLDRTARVHRCLHDWQALRNKPRLPVDLAFHLLASLNFEVWSCSCVASGKLG